MRLIVSSALCASFLLSAPSLMAAKDIPSLPEVISQADTPLAPSNDGPPTVAAPVTQVDVTPSHIVDLQQKLRDHPSQQRSEQRVCDAKWGIMLGKSNYYPRLNASLSGGTKWIDQTSRADEFGGSNSREFDGKGLNATLSLRQHIYDWGRNASIIAGHREDRFAAQIERSATLEEQLGNSARLALDYV